VLLLREGFSTELESIPDVSRAVLVSPHGSQAGVYAHCKGDLAGFGLPTISVDRSSDRSLAEEIAEHWGRPLLNEPLDHGAVVPLAMGIGSNVNVTVCTLPEVTGPRALSLGKALKYEVEPLIDVLRGVGDDVALIFSAHGSACLSERGPMLPNPVGSEVQHKISEALSGEVKRLRSITLEEWVASGSCSVAPLFLLYFLFSGRRSRLLAEEAPFGVGYMTARVE
jgi:aromatic ring-opening dioxygenase LigB subunit